MKAREKMQLIGDIRLHFPISAIDRAVILRSFCSFGHAIADQEFLGRTSDGVVEDLTEVASVQAAAGCDILNGNIILEILFNKKRAPP